MLRQPGIFERALILSDLHSPFNVVSVLRMENPPSPEIVLSVLEMLQKRHPLLRACIKNGAFESLPEPGIAFTILARKYDLQWLEVVEQEMNTRLDASTHLWHAIYIFGDPHAELILTFHHATMDAASGTNLLDELLRTCVGSTELPALELVPPLDERIPHALTGLRGLLPTLKYAAAQMADEFSYWMRVRGKRVPPVKPGGSGYPLTITLPEALVDNLSRRSRGEKVTLNSLLNVVLMLALNRHVYGGMSTPMRTFAFADLRPYTVPPTSPENLANYISMMRFTLEVSGNDDIWQLARALQATIYPALKQGDKFIASLMSEGLMKMFLAIKSMRMGAVGLNYSGAVPLQTVYGNIKVTGLHGFLSSYDIGPEVSAQARIFNDELWIDFMLLDSDMGRDLAEKIISEVKSILEKAGGG